MRFTLKTLTVMFAVALLAWTAGAAAFTVALDRDAITLGEQVTLSLKFDGVQPQDAPTIPGIAGLQFQYVGPSSSFSFINGQASSSIAYNYTVTAQRAGEFTIPAMRADIGGQQFASEPLKLTVSKPSAPSTAAVNSGNEVAFMKFNFPKNKIYVGQSVVAQLELYLRDDVQNSGNFQLSPLSMDGLSAGKIVQGQQRRAQVGNRIYNVVPLLVPATAVKSGTFALGPFNASIVVVLPGQNQNGDPFFRMFNQGEQKQVALVTEPVNIESLPLPEQGKPANFTGAVGNFTMNATAGPTTVTAGDPITVRVRISGQGSLDSLTLPSQEAWQNFKAYPPTAKVEAADQFGFQGAKTFEQIISPLNSDVHELPPLTFAFFNPDDGQYHTLMQAAVPLVVRAAGATPLPTLAASKNPAPENQTPSDVLPIKQELGALVPVNAPLLARPIFLATQAVPVLAFIAAFIWRKRTDNLANNPRLRRQRAVAALLASGKDELKKHAAANQPGEFFATLFRLLQEQLGERLDCPASAITEDVVDGHTLLRNAPSTLRTALHEQFQLCNQARYAPVRGTSELNSVAAQFEKLIGELQNLKS